MGLFSLQEKNIFPVYKIFHGLCSESTCNEWCESKCNMTTRLGEHNNPTYDSEPAKHLNKNIQHSYSWKILAKASKHIRKEPRSNINSLIKVSFKRSIKT